MLLGNFARKAYNRYVKKKANEGDIYAKAEIAARRIYQQSKGEVPEELEDSLARSMGINITDKDTTDTYREVNRGGRYSKKGFFKQKVDPLVQKKKRRLNYIAMNKEVKPPVIEVGIPKTSNNTANKIRIGTKGKVALGLGALAIGGLIAVKATQRKTKKGKVVSIKGYSRKRKKR